MNEEFEVHTGETVYLGVDFVNLLEEGESISSADVNDGGANIVKSVAFSGSKVTARVSGFVADALYALWFQATGSGGSVRRFLRLVNCAADPVYSIPPAELEKPVVSSFTVGTPADLVVPITAFAATDNVAITGYLVTESATPPSNTSEAGWSFTPPSDYTVSAYGTRTLYPWVRDSSGNVSAAFGTPRAVFTYDQAAPVVNGFMVGSPTNLTIPITVFVATDNVAVTGYLITESDTPPAAAAAGWTQAPPASFVASGYGEKTLYPWARDAIGNVSAVYGSPQTVTFPDTGKPTITAFALGAPSDLSVPVNTFTAADNVAVTGYLITESATPPSAGAAGWTESAPASYVTLAYGSKNLYPWAKDAAGNVSAAASPVAVTFVDGVAPVVGTFTVGVVSYMTVPITAFNASDNVAVMAYMVTESSTPPLPSSNLWSPTPPASYTGSTAGAKSLYPWAKDSAGNVSAAFGTPRSVTFVTPPDVTAPEVTAFIVGSPSGLSVSITAFTATDNAAVAAYLITESSATPSANDPNWNASALTSYTVASPGSKSLYPWAKDTSGNISAVFGTPRTVIFADTTAPSVTDFTVGTPADLTVPISTFTATDNVSVTGYLITESSTPPAAGSGAWSGTPPTSYTASTYGAKMLYPWVKDASGNVSGVSGLTRSVTFVDGTAPVVTAFTVGTPGDLTVSVTAFTATDNVAVTAYLITESSTPPAAGAAGWNGSAPASYSSASYGNKTLYPWAKDAAGNVSAAFGTPRSVTFTDATAPIVSTFTVGSPSNLSVPVTAFNATDNAAVTGYLITESSTPPAAGAAGWTGTAPASYTTASYGTKSLYPWVKDAAGNVSSAFGTPRSVTFADATAPTVDTFTVGSPTGLTVPITDFTATDNVAVTGYMVTESSTPPAAGAGGWSGTSPTSYSTATIGTKSLYPWVKDAAGNVSSAFGSPRSVTFTDAVAPTVDTFTVGSPVGGTVPVTAFTASDNVAVSGYMVTESSTPPAAGDAGWSGTAPTSYTTASAGTKTLYPWVKDTAGNVSTAFSTPRSVTFTFVEDTFSNSNFDTTLFGTSIASTGSVTEGSSGLAITSGAAAQAAMAYRKRSFTRGTDSGTVKTRLTNTTGSTNVLFGLMVYQHTSYPVVDVAANINSRRQVYCYFDGNGPQGHIAYIDSGGNQQLIGSGFAYSAATEYEITFEFNTTQWRMTVTRVSDSTQMDTSGWVNWSSVRANANGMYIAWGDPYNDNFTCNATFKLYSEF